MDHRQHLDGFGIGRTGNDHAELGTTDVALGNHTAGEAQQIVPHRRRVVGNKHTAPALSDIGLENQRKANATALGKA